MADPTGPGFSACPQASRSPAARLIPSSRAVHSDPDPMAAPSVQPASTTPHSRRNHRGNCLRHRRLHYRRHGHSRRVRAAALLIAIWLLMAVWLLAAPGVPAEAAAETAAGGPWRWPITGATGTTGGPGTADVVRGFDPPAQPWLPGHRGVDLAAVPGQRVMAAGAGTVTFAGSIAGRGVVTVTHPGSGLRTTYEPVEPTVSAGDVVAAGAVLGRLQVDGSHCWSSCLHWGLLRGSTYLDPLLLLRTPRIRLLPHLDAAFIPSTAAGFSTSGPADRAADRAYADPNGYTGPGNSSDNSPAGGEPRVVTVGADAADDSGERSPLGRGQGALAAVGGTALAVLAGAVRQRPSRSRRAREP